MRTVMVVAPPDSSSIIPLDGSPKVTVLSSAGIVKVSSSLSVSTVQMSLVSPSVSVMVTTSATSAMSSSLIRIASGKEAVLLPSAVKAPLTIGFSTSLAGAIDQPKGIAMLGVTLAITSGPCTVPLSSAGPDTVPVNPMMVVSLSSIVTTCLVLLPISHPSGKDPAFSLNTRVTVSFSSTRVSLPGTRSMETDVSPPSGRFRTPVLSVYSAPLME